jgi:hypothetical protein
VNHYRCILPMQLLMAHSQFLLWDPVRTHPQHMESIKCPHCYDAADPNRTVFSRGIERKESAGVRRVVGLFQNTYVQSYTYVHRNCALPIVPVVY